MNLSRKIISLGTVCCLTAGILISSNPIFGRNQNSHVKQTKNVIMLVMDGTSTPAITLSRWYKGKPLALDSILTGGMHTYCSESAITDSAPAATAMATGHKSDAGYIGVLPNVITMPDVELVKEDDYLRPVANVLEGAKLKGKSTGLVATSEIQHATPAGFSAHHVNRNNFSEIAEQQVYQNLDIVLGGGKKALLPQGRYDGENLVSELERKGYDIVENRDEMLKSNSQKIWGAFSETAMAYEMDRNTIKPEEPSLAEMTQKAIQTLSKDKDGFFLMVEGSKIDWAAHANDPVGMISDVLAFDEAVKKSLDFAKKDKNTLVIAVTDHGNSGISIGSSKLPKYDKAHSSNFINPLKKALLTIEGAVLQLKDDRSNLKEVAKKYGLDDLTDEEYNRLMSAKDTKEISALMSKMLSDRAYLGFTTGGHTGEEVALYAYGPYKPTGLIDNTDIAKVIANSMGLDLNKLSQKLFVDAAVGFGKIGAKISIDNKDASNPVLVVNQGSVKAELVISKNIMKLNGKLIELQGVTVSSNEKVYVPQQAIDLFEKALKQK